VIPLSYTLRNLWNHKVTSFLTLFGVMLVVFVFAAVLMLADGLLKTLVSTGADDNAIIIRKASQTEVTSVIFRGQSDIISTYPEIKTGADNLPMFTNELYVLISGQKRETGDNSNIVVRGVTEHSMELRPHVKLMEGRMWKPGTAEIIAGKSVAKRFKNCGLGETMRFGSREWTVVGIFDAGGSAFDSEIWGDIEQLMDAFRRPVYSSLTFKLTDPTQYEIVKQRIDGDRRLSLDVKREKEYYTEQSRATTSFIKIVGVVICVVFSFGAIIGAMITMYAAVANRTKEIGTLRSLGFSRLAILNAFLFEAIFISVLGGVLGLVAASFLHLMQISTLNFNTFSELAFNFSLNLQTIIASLIFALLMGLVGGFLPAVRASRLKIVDALRAA
jgi:putative ABC transport system permease protein